MKADESRRRQTKIHEDKDKQTKTKTKKDNRIFRFVELFFFCVLRFAFCVLRFPVGRKTSAESSPGDGPLLGCSAVSKLLSRQACGPSVARVDRSPAVF